MSGHFTFTLHISSISIAFNIHLFFSDDFRPGWRNNPKSGTQCKPQLKLENLQIFIKPKNFFKADLPYWIINTNNNAKMYAPLKRAAIFTGTRAISMAERMLKSTNILLFFLVHYHGSIEFYMRYSRNRMDTSTFVYLYRGRKRSAYRVHPKYTQVKRTPKPPWKLFASLTPSVPTHDHACV